MPEGGVLKGKDGTEWAAVLPAVSFTPAQDHQVKLPISLIHKIASIPEKTDIRQSESGCWDKYQKKEANTVSFIPTY